MDTERDAHRSQTKRVRKALLQPNILVVVTDQQRANWLGCAGDPLLETPNIDRIATAGTRFSRAYCANPVCMPSRATLLTGLLPSDHGVRSNGISLSSQELTLPEILHCKGYSTTIVGKPHFSNWWVSPQRTPNIDDLDANLLPEAWYNWEHRKRTKLPSPYFGFDNSFFVGGHSATIFGEYLHWLQDNFPQIAVDFTSRSTMRPSLHRESFYPAIPEELYYTEWITQRTVETIAKHKKDSPFFMWCSYPDPHHPFGPPSPWNTQYNPNELPMPVAWNDDRKLMPPHFQLDYYAKRKKVAGGPIVTNNSSLAQVQEMRALAYGMIGLVDRGVGRIIDCLQSTGHWRDTIVVFLSDHGELMGDHGILNKGPYHYQGLLKVPFLMSWPGRIRSGHVAEGLVSLLDFVPTLLELSGVSYPQRPFSDFAGPEPAQISRQSSMYDGVQRLPGKSLVPLLTGETTQIQDSVLIENDEDYRDVSLRTIITDDAILTRYRKNICGELFDLNRDPDQENNLWGNPNAVALQSKAEEQLLEKIMITQARHRRQISSA